MKDDRESIERNYSKERIGEKFYLGVFSVQFVSIWDKNVFDSKIKLLVVQFCFAWFIQTASKTLLIEMIEKRWEREEKMHN